MTPSEFAMSVLDLEEEVRHLRRENAVMREELDRRRADDRKNDDINMQEIGNILRLLVDDKQK
jgi:hypothetical protein